MRRGSRAGSRYRAGRRDLLCCRSGGVLPTLASQRCRRSSTVVAETLLLRKHSSAALRMTCRRDVSSVLETLSTLDTKNILERYSVHGHVA